VAKPTQKPQKNRLREIGEDEEPNARQIEEYRSTTDGPNDADFWEEWGNFRDHNLMYGNKLANWDVAWKRWLSKRY
jgi:hypothetical protein